MYVLHVCSNYFPAHGGPQYTMKNVSEKLILYYNDTLEVATSNSLYGPDLPMFKRIEPSVEMVNGVKVFRYPLRNWHYKILEFGNRILKKVFKKPMPHYIYKYRNELDCKGILNKMKQTNADVIMATTSNYMFCDYPFWRFKTKNPKPFVLNGAMHLHINWTIHSPIFARAKACDCYIANTNYEKQWLVERGINNDKIVTIGTGIAINDYVCTKKQADDFRQQNNIDNDDILIGYIGRLSEGKGAGILLDAFIRVYNTNNRVKLLLAGTYTGYVPALKAKISTLNLPVILLEDFENTMKPVLFNALDIFVLASKGESFGVVFLEAWACKKPVIGVRTGAIASVIAEETDGLLFEMENTIALSDKLDYLVKNHPERSRLGKNGYQKVVENYTWEKVIPKYRAAYLKGIEHFNTLREAQSL